MWKMSSDLFIYKKVSIHNKHMIEIYYTSEITLFLRSCVSFHSSFTTTLKYIIPEQKRR